MKNILIAVAAFVAFTAGAVEIKEKTIGGETVRWFEEMVPMKDGTRLYTYGPAPAPGEKLAVVIIRTPYVKEQPVEDMAAYAAKQKAVLKRGYVRIIQHCRGCGMSEGDWIPYENERSDGLDLLEWVRGLPFYNGEIFLEGGSYLATVHWAYLGTNPPDVKGAYLTIQDPNRYNISYRHGFFRLGSHGRWFSGGYKKKNKALKRDKSVTLWQRPLADFPERYWGERVPAFENRVLHPRPDDPYWTSSAPGSGADFRRALLDSTMPVALATGFYDLYTVGIFDMWRELPPERRANCTLVVDPYDHSGVCCKALKGTAGEFPGGERRNNDLKPLDWFDYCRHGRKAKNMEVGKTRYYALWENEWKVADELTNGPVAVKIPLASAPADFCAWTYDPARPLPVFPGSGGISGGGMQPQPQPGFRDDVVSFILPEIKERLDVRGRMELSLTVQSDCDDTCIYARLSVRKKGDSRWLLLRDDITSLEWTKPYVPGEKRVVRFRFPDHAFRLDKGDVLRVDVASGSDQYPAHSNIRGLQCRITETKVAHNRIYPSDSELTLYAETVSGMKH